MHAHHHAGFPNGCRATSFSGKVVDAGRGVWGGRCVFAGAGLAGCGVSGRQTVAFN